MRTNRGDTAVTPVIGIILMVALTVILAAVTGTFVLGIADNMSEGVQAGADATFEKEQVTVIYISNKNAEHLNVTFTGWGEEGVAQLNTTGARATLTPGGFNVSGNAWKPVDITNPNFPNPGDEITVTVVAEQGNNAAVILDETGRI